MRIELPDRYEPFDYPAAFQVLEGWVRISSARGDLRFGPGDVCLNPMGVPLVCEWEDLTIASMRVPTSAIEDLASELTGIEPRNLRFDPAQPVSAAMGQHWRRVAGYVYRELMAPDSALGNPIICAEVALMSAAATLATFANTSMTMPYQPHPGQVAPAAVRRAIAYLRRVRLARAHQELVAADPTAGATVAAIASRWGFMRPTRFAALYQDTYAEPPSHTLRT